MLSNGRSGCLQDGQPSASVCRGAKAISEQLRAFKAQTGAAQKSAADAAKGAAAAQKVQAAQQAQLAALEREVAALRASPSHPSPQRPPSPQLPTADLQVNSVVAAPSQHILRWHNRLINLNSK